MPVWDNAQRHFTPKIKNGSFIETSRSLMPVEQSDAAFQHCEHVVELTIAQSNQIDFVAGFE